jgi:hypothetical protein
VTAATAATADHVLAALFNPSGTKRINVVEITLFATAVATSGDGYWIQRTSSRGTEGSTVTPDADNANDGVTSPSSGAILGLAAYSAQPTLRTPQMWGWSIPVIPAVGFIWQPRSIVIPAGEGVAITQRVASAAPICEVTFVFED